MTKHLPIPHMHAASLPAAMPPVSPLILCDRLIQAAQDADRAGYAHTAARLVALVDQMFEPASHHN